MSKTTITERKSFIHSAMLKNIAIYGACLLFGFVLTLFGVEITRSMSGYIVIATAVTIYLTLGYLTFVKFIPELNTVRIRKKKGTYYNKAYKLRDSLKKNFILLTFLLLGVILLVVLNPSINSVHSSLLS